MKKSLLLKLAASFAVVVGIASIGLANNATGSQFLHSIKSFLNAEAAFPSSPTQTSTAKLAKSDLINAAYQPMTSVFGPLSGPTTVSYTAMTSITCPADPVATISPAVSGLTFSQISHGSGVTCSAAAGSVSGSGFNGSLATNIGANKWYTFSITSDASTTFTVSALSIQSRVSNAGGSPNDSVQYSIGGTSPTNVIGSFTPTTTSTAYPVTPGTAISVGASQTLNIYVIPNGLSASTTTSRVENATSATVTTTPVGGGSTPPTLTAAAGATVDNDFNVTFTDDSAWRAAVTAVKCGSSTLTSGTDFILASGTLTLKPSGGNTCLRTAAPTGSTITASATGYLDTNVTQPMGPGAIASYNVSAASPQVVGAPFTTTVTAKDQYANTVTTNNSTVVTMSSGGNMQFDSNGDATFGDNTKVLTAGTFTISTKDNVGETTTITATDGNSKTGTSASVTVAVAANYKSKQSGNWNDFNTWSIDTGSGFVDAISGQTPTSADGTIEIQNAHVVTVSAAVSADQLTVDAGGQLIIASSQTFTLANGVGTDLTVNGTVIDSGTFTDSAATWTVSATGTFVYNTTTGISTPLGNATLDPASTFIYRGSSTINATPSVSGRTYGNLVLESTTGAYAPLSSSGAGAFLVNGSLSVGATGTGTVSYNTTGFTGSLTVSGGLNVGSGSTLTIGNSTTVVAGTSSVQGNLTTTNSVTYNGTLKGTGTISGATSIGSTGTVAPGNSPGILNTGNITFASGATFSAEFGGTTAGNTATSYDQLNVIGTVNLGGATLSNASFGGFAPSAGQNFTIINNDGGDAITGTFTGLTEGASIPNFLGSGLAATITYLGGDGNDVVISLPAAAAATSTSISSSTGGTSNVGQNVTFTATVTSSSTVNSGTVSFYDSATCSGTVIASGLAVNGSSEAQTSTSSLALGDHTISACYNGNATFAASSTSMVQHVLPPAPTVASVSPNSGTADGGTSVIITGSNFTGATAVNFGGTAATTFNVTDATHITATTPGHAGGAVSVDVTTPSGTNAPNSLYTFVVTNFTLTQGNWSNPANWTPSYPGTTIAAGITVNAGTVGNVATIDTPVTISGNLISVTSSSLNIVAPGTLTITSGGTLTNNNGFSNNHEPFDLQSGSTFANNENATLGSAVTLAGNFINNTPGSLLFQSAAITGNLTNGSGFIKTGSQPSTVSGNYNNGTGTFEVDYFKDGGVLSGSVSANGTAMLAGSFAFNTNGTVTMPDVGDSFDVLHATGGITGTFSNATYDLGNGTRARATYTSTDVLISIESSLPAPTVTSVSPTSGPTAGGTVVTITGTNLTGATAVKFGGNSATTFTVNTPTSITATSPASTGTVDVTVTTPGGTSVATVADQFTYIAPPTVTSISPTSGPAAGGTSVTITGTGFTGATAVNFGATTAAFTFNSATSITATAPAHAAGLVDVTVSAAGGTSGVTANDQFTYRGTTSLAVTTSGSPSVVGQLVTFTATISVVSGTGTPTGTVTFTDSATGAAIPGCSSQAVAAGTPSIAPCTTNALTAGSHTITAVYSGDANFSGSSNSMTQTVVKATPTLALGTSGSPSVVGQSVTFTATFGPSGLSPSGTVRFADSVTGLAIPGCSSQTITSNAATCITNLLAQGSHTITASYAGDANFNASSSSGLTQLVNPSVATHFSVIAPANVTAGNAFSITVAARDASNNTVTGYAGTVNFTTSDSGSGTILPANYTFVAGDNGVHTFTNGATLVTAGSQTVTATDTSTAITGTSDSITVSPASATHFTVSAPASVTAGNAFSFTVTARDGFNNAVASYAGTVAFTKTDNAPGSVVPGNYTFVAGDNGVHTFTNGATLVTPGNQTITATDTVTAVISGTSNSISVAATACAPQPTGMVSWFRAEGNALDTRGNNNGTLVNAPTFVAGEVGQAFNLNGTNQYVEVGDNPTNSITGALSIDAWINPASVSSGQTIVSKYDHGSNQVSYFFGMQPGGALQFVVYNDAAGVVFRGVQTTSTVPAGVFTHVAAVFDPSNGNMKIYNNGVDTSAPFITNSSVVLSIADTTAALRIGAVVDQFGGIVPFSGALDEVEIFNRPITGTEVANIYNASTTGKCTDVGLGSSLAAWLPGDGDTRDITGNGNAGTLMNGAGFGVGKVGQAFSLNGTNQYVKIADSPGVRPTSLTIETWIKPSVNIGGTSSIMAKTLGGGPLDSYETFYENGMLQGLICDNSGEGPRLQFATSLNQNTWYHVAYSYDDATHTQALYLNGALVASGSTGGKSPAFDTHPLLLGADTENGTEGAFPFPGAIDEASLYGRALSANEITSVFNAGLAGKYKSVATPIGAAVSSNAGGDATATFGNVSTGGTTQQVPIDGTLYPALPQTPLGLYYDVATTATFTGGVTVCFHLPLASAPTSPIFHLMRIDHFENGGWVDRTDTSTTNFATQTLCTTSLASLSPFAIASVSPTAAGVTISGRVLAPGGGALRNASVVMTGADGVTMRAMTNAFGYYKFDDVQSGGSYIMGVESRRFRYGTRVIQITDSLADIDFTPIE